MGSRPARSGSPPDPGPRIALLLAYDGTAFHGFARQPRQRTVQGELERTLAEILRGPVTTRAAGRTDAGVHAWSQVLHFDVPAPGGVGPGASPPRGPGRRGGGGPGIDLAGLASRANQRLGPEVAVRAAAVVPSDFDARFSAVRRTYEYRIYRSAHPDPFLDRFAVHAPGVLRLAPMRRAARVLEGEHDFSSFCRDDGRTRVRRVAAVRISVPAPGRALIRVAANAFCQQMIRSLVGTLIEIGSGRRSPEDMPAILAARDRAAAGPVASARGLHLVEVRYRPDPFRHALSG